MDKTILPTLELEYLWSQSLMLYERDLTDKELQLVAQTNGHTKSSSEEAQKRFTWDESLTAKRTNRQVPAWLSFFQREVASNAADSRVPENFHLIPFAHLLWPWVEAASRTSASELNIGNSIALNLQEILLRRLSNLASQVLYEEFNRLRGFEPNLVSLNFCDENELKCQHSYLSFVNHHLRNNLRSIAHSYPVLIRLLSDVSLLWTGNVQDFFTRLQTDWPDINHKLLPDSLPTPQLESIYSSGSDAHNGAQLVLIAEFTNGNRVVYKPRSGQGEVCLRRTLDTLQNLNFPIELRSPATIDCGRYCWSEFVEFRPLTEEAEVPLFARRAGALLALCWHLGASDCHFENFIACGAMPIIIDAEAIVPVTIDKWGHKPLNSQAHWLLTEQLGRSVLTTGMLPHIIKDGSGGVFDIGAFSAKPSPTRRQRILINVNSDQMCWQKKQPSAETHRNLPILGDTPISIRDSLEPFIEGFKQTITWLRHNSAQFETLIEELQQICSTDRFGRLIFRPTAVYAKLLTELTQPDSLSSGLAWSLKVEKLSRVFLKSDERPYTFCLLRKEHEALSRADIPYFTAHDLSGAHTSLPLRATTSSPDELKLQEKLIALSFQSSSPSRPQEINHKVPPSCSDHVAGFRDEKQFLVDAALNLSRVLLEQAIRAPDGSLAWLGADYDLELSVQNINVLGPDLYNGYLGLALVFDSLHKHFHVSTYHETTTQIISPITALYKAKKLEQLLVGNDIGGLDGLGSIIYTMSKLGENNSEYLTAGVKLAELLTPDIVAKSIHNDFTSGIAGCLMALCSLHKACPARASGDVLFERIQLCVQQLLSRRQLCGKHRVWPAGHLPPLTGLAHGMSGICLALAHSSILLKEDRIAEAICEALEFEDRCYDHQDGNWRDLRPGSSFHPFTWCYGAPGIILARGKIANLLPQLRDEVLPSTSQELLTRQLENEPCSSVDHLCCGEAGLALIAWRLAKEFGDEHLKEVARSRILPVAQRALNSELRLWPGRHITNPTPSAWRGISGIALSFLAIAGYDVPEFELLT